MPRPNASALVRRNVDGTFDDHRQEPEAHARRISELSMAAVKPFTTSPMFSHGRGDDHFVAKPGIHF
jgi:hypothetical protein